MTTAIKVGLVGFGKAGKAVASVLLQSKETDLQWVLRKTQELQHHSVQEALGLQSDEQGFILSADEFSAEELLTMFPVDVIVDFSSPQGILYYGDEAKRRKISIVSAISEYPDDILIYLQSLAKHTRVMHSPNITIGINFLLIAAKILQKIAPHADIQIIEQHFQTKPETSGTAKILAHELSVPADDIKSVRAGGIIGVHEVLFGFPYQSVRLKHESISREAFGNGILFALRNFPDSAGHVITMEDLLKPHFDLNRAAEQPVLSAGSALWGFWPGP
jgi:4-hydroxy-tetrahydrodipicolinate reductase